MDFTRSNLYYELHFPHNSNFQFKHGNGRVVFRMSRAFSASFSAIITTGT